MGLRSPCLLRALLPLLMAAVLAAGCSSSAKRQATEKARLQKQSEAALQELNGRHPGNGGSQEIPGLSSPAPEEVASRPRPEWAGDGVSASYPPELYLTGVGSAQQGNGNDYKTLAMAEDRARAELAKSIRVRVQSEFENAARLVTESASGKTATLQDRNETTDRIRSRADVELEGVHVVDRWFDRPSGTYWALAALERATAGRRLLDRMEQLRRQSGVDRELGQGFANEGQRVQGAAYLQRAAGAVYGVLNLRAQLNAIAPALLRDQPAEPLPMAALLKDATVALERLRVKMVVFADAEGATVTPADAETLIAAALRKDKLNVTRLNAAPPGGYDDLAGQSVETQRVWAGAETDILLLAHLSTKQVAERAMENMTMRFYQARGSALVIGLGAERLLTSANFDWLPKSHSAHAERQRAAELALHEGAAELADRLRLGIVEALGMTKE